MKQNKPFRYWENHIDEIYEEAKKYKTVMDFAKNSRCAYSASRRLGIYEEVCKNLLRKGQIGLTFDEIKAEAKKYKTISEFQKGSPKIYHYVKTNFLIDQVCSHMDLSERKRRLKKLLPEKEIIKIAKKYNRRCDFNTKENLASKSAKQLGIYEKVCEHMNKIKKIYNPITKKKETFLPTLEEILKISKKYKTREEFKAKNRTLYDYCSRQKIFDLACEHMPIDASHKHSFESIFNNAKKCKTVTEFNLKFPLDYKSAKRRGFLEKICKTLDYEQRDHSVSIGERTTLHYINRLLGIKLKPAKHIKWLKYKNNYLSLDGFDEENKIAFEYNGHLHLKPKIKRKDNFKKKICKKLGIKFIIIREYKDIKRSDFKGSIPKAVKRVCTKLDLTIINPNTKVIIQTNSNHMNIKKLKKLISKYKILKTFMENQTKAYRFICSHQLHYLMKDLKRYQKKKR